MTFIKWRAWGLAGAGLVGLLLAACGGGGGAGNPVADGATVIVEAPAHASVKAGEAARFSVRANGVGLTYQWQRDDQNVPGANQSSFTLAAAQAADHGSRWTVRVSGSGGSVTSAPVRLSVLAITSAPASREVAAGQAVSFEVQATGDELRFQWRRNGVDVPGATQSRWTLAAVPLSEDGSRWSVRVANAAGELNSADAVVAVRAGPATGLRRVAGDLTGPGFADGPAAEARFENPIALTRGPDGRFFVADQSGISLRQVDADGRTSIVAGRRPPGRSAAVDAQGVPIHFGFLAATPDGMIYASSGPELREIAADGRVSTWWRPGPGQLDGPLGTATAASLGALASDPQGRLHVADSACSIRTIDRAAGRVVTRARTSPCPGDGQGVSLAGVSALAWHASGDLIAVAGQRLLRVTEQGQTTVVHEVSDPSQGLERSLAQDAAGNVYALVRNLRAQPPAVAVIRVGLDGRITGVDAGPPVGLRGVFGVGADGTLVSFDDRGVLWTTPIRPGTPRVLAGRDAGFSGRPITGPFAVGAAGEVLALNEAGTELLRFGPDGSVDSIALDAAVGPVPVAMVAGADGNLYALALRPAAQFTFTGFRDTRGGLVYRLSRSGRVERLAGGDGVDPADGPVATARFQDASGLAIDSHGVLYLVDRQGFQTSAIRRIAPDGTVSTLGSSAWADHVAVDGAGRVYLATARESRVRRLTPAGVETVIFDAPRAAGADVPLGPTGVTGLVADADGNVFVAHDDGLIRRIGATGDLGVLAGTDGVYGVRLGALPVAVGLASHLALDPAGTLHLRAEQAVLALPTGR